MCRKATGFLAFKNPQPDGMRLTCISHVAIYSLRAFSRPAHWLLWLGYPYARLEQARFRRLKGKSMQHAVIFSGTLK